jgi:hypothetical protein
MAAPAVPLEATDRSPNEGEHNLLSFHLHASGTTCSTPCWRSNDNAFYFDPRQGAEVFKSIVSYPSHVKVHFGFVCF